MFNHLFAPSQIDQAFALWHTPPAPPRSLHILPNGRSLPAVPAAVPAADRSGVWHRDASASCCPLAAVAAADHRGARHRDAAATSCPLAASTAADRHGVWHRAASASCCPLAAVAAADHSGACHRDASATCHSLAASSAAGCGWGIWHQDASGSRRPLAADAAADRSGVWHRDAGATCSPLAAPTAADRSGVWHQDASASCCPLAAVAAADRSSVWHRDASATCGPLAAYTAADNRGVWHRDASATCYPAGLVYFQDLFTDVGFASFKFRCEDHNLPKCHFCRYLQGRSFASKFFPGYPSPPSKDLLYLVLNVNPFNEYQISKIYALILDSCPHTWDQIKAAWEGEVGEIIPENTWKKNHTAYTHIFSLY